MEVKAEVESLKLRTRRFALQIIKLFRILPTTTEAQIIGKQILRSGTSVGAQYRETKRARSRAEFASKLENALQELEETGYWLELLAEAEILPKIKLDDLMREQNELVAIFVSSVNSTKHF